MKLAFIFPGQGSQHVGMGKGLYEAFQEVRALYDEASETLGYDMAALSFEGPEKELNLTMRTQPALLTASVAALRTLGLKGVRPDAVAGHSLGEYTAVVAAGALSFADALRITEYRGKLMQEAVPEGKGLMAAVLGLGREPVDEACASITSGTSGYVAPANYNCPGQIVISGETPAVQEAMERLKEAGAKRVVPLAVSVPSHSRMMDEAAKTLSEHLFLGDIEMSDPAIPVICNSEASFLRTADGIKAALVRQLNSPVLWEYSVAAMINEGIETFVEAGPGKVLSGLVKRCSKVAGIHNVQDPESLEKTVSEFNA
jgi:[acyl-carrier-protein] S-malonyltransferase